jgi:hypothetical protein
MSSTLNSSIIKDTSFSSGESTTTEMKREITLFMNPAIVERVRAEIIVENTSLSNFVENALDNYFSKEAVLKKIKISNIKT